MSLQDEKLNAIIKRAETYSNGWSNIQESFVMGAMSPESFEYWKDSPQMDEYYKTKNTIIISGQDIQLLPKDINQLKIELPTPVVENTEDSEAVENWIFAMDKGFRGYRNKVTNEWISEIVYQNRFED